LIDVHQRTNRPPTGPGSAKLTLRSSLLEITEQGTVTFLRPGEPLR